MTNSNLLGKAIRDYFENQFKDPFLIHYTDLDLDEMPIEVFFRNYDDMPEIEKYALSLVNGKILDVGAGAGAHSLLLQNRGLDVTALDNSFDSCAVMKERGLSNVVCSDVFDFSSNQYDTILLLMNGIGLAKEISNLEHTLLYLNSLLNEGGQILFDSSDLTYLEREVEGYYGEMQMRYEYNGQMSKWGHWLYIDPYTLISFCEERKIPVEIIIEDDTGLFLAKITKW